MSRTRISRTLIALLVVTIALGLVAYFHNPNRTKATDQSKANPAAPTPPILTPPVVAPSSRPVAVVPIPATRPVQIALGNAATRAIVTQTPGGVAKIESPRPVEKTTAPKPETRPAPKPVEKTATPAARPASPARNGNALADGRAMIEANNLLAGRKVLNDALLAGSLTGADAQAAKELIEKANQTLVLSARRISDDPYSGTYVVQPGDKPMKIAASHDVTWDFMARLNNIPDPRKLRAGATLKTIRGPFHAVVTKSKFTLDLYLGSPGEKGSMYVCTYRVGLGKNNSTPVGTWMVTPQSKLKNPKWWGTADEPAREADDPKNPLGEFWIGLQGTDGEAVGKSGYGIHGTIEPDTIGKEASHGCIRLLAQDIERLYEMLIEGKSTVIIKE